MRDDLRVRPAAVTMIIVTLTLALSRPPSTFAQSQAPANDGAQNPTPQDDPTTWPECDEYKALSKCKIVIQMAAKPDGNHLPHAHWDVVIKPAGRSAVILENSSPFLSCVLAANPSPLARDVTSSITSFLTSLGTAGLFVNFRHTKASGPMSETQRNAATGQDEETEATKASKEINRQFTQLENDLQLVPAQVNRFASMYQNAYKTFNENWAYTYESEAVFAQKATEMWQTISDVLGTNVPNAQSIQVELNALNTSIANFHRRFDANAAAQEFIGKANDRLDEDTGYANLVQEKINEIINVRNQLKQVRDVLTSLSTNPNEPGQFSPDGHLTTVVLPMSYFSEKQVTETITCKDVITQNQPFDTITFTAFYESSPKWDFSAGAVISLLGGRQVGAVSGPLSQGSAPTVLAVTQSSSTQWIPGAFFEYHPWNFHCPWAKSNGAATHNWGYVCSFGPAFGLLINPNNGSTKAEYFEALSFGIQRIAFFVGNHTGKFQEFGSGYFVGQTVPSGTTPPTRTRWTNHPAFGISYRIPLR